MAELKRSPCRKCGAVPKLRKYRDDLIVVCYSLKCNCGIRMRDDGIDPEAVKRKLVKRWNRENS